MTKRKDVRWWEDAKENEYTRKEVQEIMKFKQCKIHRLKEAGTIKQTRNGFYDKASVDAYQADREERLAIMEGKR